MYIHVCYLKALDKKQNKMFMIDEPFLVHFEPVTWQKMGCYLIPVTILNKTVHHQSCTTYMLCFSYEIVCAFKTHACNCLFFVTFYTPEGCSLHSRSNPQTAIQMVARCPSPNSSRKLSRMFKRLRKAVILSFILLTLKNNQIIIT